MAILVTAGDFAAPADDLGLTRRQIIVHIAIVSVAVGLGHEQVDIAAYDLFGRIAENALGGRVERFDGAVLVDGGDTVDGVVQYGPQSCLAPCQILTLAR